MKLRLPSIFCSTLIVIGLLFFGHYSFAQQSHTITGHVTDASGKSLAGVTVSVKGKKVSTVTSDNGGFTIAAEVNDVLVFTSIGYKEQQQKAGSRSVINITLRSEVKSLENVLVTALGIRRERRSLGYSVTTVAGSSLTEARETNFVNGLEGKVAGVNVSNVATGPGVRQMW